MVKKNIYKTEVWFSTERNEMLRSVGVKKVMNTKKVYLFICFLALFLSFCSQKNSEYLHKLQIQSVSYIDTDTARVWVTEGIPDLLIFSLPKTNGEYFVMEDTSHRDYILLNGDKYLIDSLWLKKYDNYAVFFEYIGGGTYIISDKESSYLIINGSNGFQMGTDVQPLYAIFQKKENKYIFLSSYIIESIDYYSEEILNSVRVIFEKDKISLQGINLKCIHCN